MSDHLVKLILANPLRSLDAENLGLPIRSYAVREEVILPHGQAMRLVAAGFVQGANPQKPETVTAALTRIEASAPAGEAKPARASSAGK
ncbi:hypothetical protein [Planomonospora sp. ID82291]|uniref:hypothetical protein n=1 Tax=Planomonospora sp. ID82291 TaxID=2738136 RepID=UPI0018C40D52|nr:hypothetical protein [Planomonospora sp. ID82291]MBG0818739.1 hypothetical protein [Planomonospora sp. ID82291]